MFKLNIALALAMATGFSGSAQAAILSATPANFAAVFAAAKSGDTIKAVGSFGTLGLNNRIFTSTVTIDATNAVFTDTLSINNVSKLTITGGTFGSATADMRTGRAVGVYNSNNVLFSKNFFIGNGVGVGMSTAGSSNVSVSAGNFKNFRLGLGVTSSTDVRISSSRFIGMTSDGIDIADSHRVTATTNRCTDSVPSDGAHPDCIQLWSVLGNAVQSDITLTKNTVIGATQGLTSFNPDNGGGLRISMTDNIISTSFPQGIACYGCVDSIFTGNVLTTLPGSQWRTSMNIVGGTNNIIANNSIAAKPASSASALDDGADTAVPLSYDPSVYYNEPLPDFILEDLAILNAGDPYAGGQSNGAAIIGMDSDSSIMSPRGYSARGVETSIAAVPEPTVWAQLIFGMALTGLAVRRRANGRSRSA